MREIIYIQAGNLSNHIGTHFWNAQESYFTFENASVGGAPAQPESETSEVEVNHDISFREGLSTQGDSTYCPRVIVFDHRSNFGTLGRYNELYRDAEGEGGDCSSWNGSVVEVRQGEIEKSAYQKRVDKGEDDDEAEDGADGDKRPEEEMRYWSDFNRVFYIPRSLHQVPDLPEWEASKGDWKYGRTRYERHDLDYSVRDECLRKFAEECDGLQGFHITFDNATFGSFSSAFLEHIKDDFAKASVLAFPILSGIKPDPKDVANTKNLTSVLQDAACLGAMNELECQAVLIQHPRSWTKGAWSKDLSLDLSKLYHTSAVLSALIESITYPLRTKNTAILGREGGGPLDLATFINSLNWSQASSFSHLRGALPLKLDRGEAADYPLYDFSLSEELRKGASEDHSLNVWRGCSSQAANLGSAALGRDSLNLAVVGGYPYISSFPRIIPHSSVTSAPRQASASSTIHSTRKFQLLSALSATPSTGASLETYADVVKGCTARKINANDAAGFDGGELLELEETLRHIADRYEEAWA